MRIGDTQPEGDDDDDETRVIIPSDTYDGLICAACVESSEICKTRAGSRGWMIIEQTGAGPVVVGREAMIEGEEPTRVPDDTSQKREREDDPESESKRLKTESESKVPPAPLCDDASEAVPERVNPVEPKEHNSKPTSKRDVFLAHGIREQLQSELNVSSLPPQCVRVHELTSLRPKRSLACPSHWSMRRYTNPPKMRMTVRLRDQVVCVTDDYRRDIG